MELGRELPKDYLCLVCSLTKVNDWPANLGGGSTTALLVDLDDLAKTEPLDSWALSAWRNTFNDMIARSLSIGAAAPQLVGFCREKNFSTAQMAVRIGARELLLIQDIDPWLKGSLPLVEKNEVPALNTENLIPLKTNFASEKNRSPLPTMEGSTIPKHAIPFPIEGLEGQSLAIEGVRNIIRKSAGLDTNVLITGPTGSGKERVARCLHQYSHRSRGPFVAVNCGALSPDLVEAELFGATEGAYTGAVAARPGFLKSAQGGTLFLDEVSELPLEVQVKLLRALADKSVTPVGSSQSLALDFRLICASPVDLGEKSREGSFREDLLYRIRVMEIQLPSLSERRLDIPDLGKTLLKKLARRHKKPLLDISEAVVEKFLFYSWPGNIRELENALEHGATLAWAEERGQMEVKDLPETVQFATMASNKGHDLKEAVHRFEKEYISSTIRRLGGSKEEAAESLGLSLATLYRKLGS